MLGLVIATALGWGNAASIAIAVVLAFLFGYALTLRPRVGGGLPLRKAARIALAADTVSIAVMELTDNAVILAVPGAMDAGLGAALFWAALGFSLVVTFAVTLPLNRWLSSRGKGHAVVHAYHT